MVISWPKHVKASYIQTHLSPYIMSIQCVYQINKIKIKHSAILSYAQIYGYVYIIYILVAFKNVFKIYFK
jgi:hypothetical protein